MNMMAKNGLLRMTELFPEDLDEYISTGGDAAVLPVGSVEQHGPHLPLGCDGYNAELVAKYTAEYAGAVLFPMMPLSWIGGLRAWAGTLNMRPWNTGDYLEETLLSMVRMGFRRIIVINCHGGGYEMVFSTVQSVYHKTGVHVLSMYPSRVYDAYPEIERVWSPDGGEVDWNAVENNELMGALKDFGKTDLLENVKRNMAEAYKEFGEKGPAGSPPSFRRAQALGTVGHDYIEENRHVQPMAAADPDRGIEACKIVGRKLAQALEDLKSWSKDFQKRVTSPVASDGAER
jgi:creatinine amidohydrolase/Fe(II)-dependent formamide hydrolase-like protein